MFNADSIRHLPRENIFTDIRAERINIDATPVLEDIQYSVGMSYSFFNTTYVPVTAVFNDSMRMRIKPCHPVSLAALDERIRLIKESPLYTKQKQKEMIERVPRPEKEPDSGAVYIIKQYNPGEEGIAHIGLFLEMLESNPDIVAFEKNGEGKYESLVNTDEVKFYYDYVLSYLKDQKDPDPKSLAARFRDDVDYNLANYLTVAERERQMSRARSLDNLFQVPPPPPSVRLQYVKIPVIYRIPFREIFDGTVNGINQSIYEEKTNIVFSLHPTTSAPFHPFDFHLNPKRNNESFTPGTRSGNKLSVEISRLMQEEGSSVKYRYVVSKERMKRSIDTGMGLTALYYPLLTRKDAVGRLRPYECDSTYPDEGVYIYTSEWDDNLNEFVEHQEYIPLHDIKALNSVGLWESRAAALSHNTYQSQAEHEKALSDRKKNDATIASLDIKNEKEQYELKSKKEDRQEAIEEKHSLFGKLKKWSSGLTDAHKAILAISGIITVGLGIWKVALPLWGFLKAFGTHMAAFKVNTAATAAAI